MHMRIIGHPSTVRMGITELNLFNPNYNYDRISLFISMLVAFSNGNINGIKVTIG